MHLAQLSTLNFRNLQPAELHFSAGVCGVWGENGAGKTNLLEAIYLAATGRTEATRNEEHVTQGEDEAYIRANFHDDHGLTVHEVGIGVGKKMLRRDGVRVSVADLPRGSAVFVRPEDSDLIFGSPKKRREFLDSLLSRLDHTYAAALARYEKVLSQRNAALRQGLREADLWDAPLIDDAIFLMNRRRRLILAIGPLLAESNEKIGSRKSLTLHLQESAPPDRFVEELQRSLPESLRRGSTLVGPHRDDVQILLGGLPSGAYASRGEGRTVALALRLAEFEMLQRRYHRSPLLLLDDWTAELDPERRVFLLDLAASVPQAVVSGTEPPPHATTLLRAIGGRFL